MPPVAALQRSIRQVLAILVVLGGLLIGAAVTARGDESTDTAPSGASVPGAGAAGEAVPGAAARSGASVPGAGTAGEAVPGAAARSGASEAGAGAGQAGGTRAPLARVPVVRGAQDAPQAWAPGVRSARAYVRSRPGTVSFAVRTRGRSWGFRGDRVVRSASVVKAMLLVAYLNEPAVRRRALSARERRLLAPMIQWSSNDAASAVRDRVGDDGLRRLAQRAGMTAFATAPAWGMSSITANDQSRFFLKLERLVPPRHRPYALRLLRTIVPEQRWGLGRAVPRGWELHFKGGWGTGSGAVNHQVALLRRGEERVAVAILTTGSPSHAYGSETLRGVARRLLRGLDGVGGGEPLVPPAPVTTAR